MIGKSIGHFKITINNRRTNSILEVFSPVWESIAPEEVHQPWEGFGDLSLTVRGEDVPVKASYGLRRLSADEGEEPLECLRVSPVEFGGTPLAYVTIVDARHPDFRPTEDGLTGPPSP